MTYSDKLKDMKIEKNIPIPEKQSKRLMYPWPDLEVGDSFFIEDYTRKKQIGISSSAFIWFRKHKPHGKIVTRRVEGGIRVWRFK